MGTDGIGRKRNNTGGRFVLKDVLSGGKLVYSSENQKIETENAYSRLELKSPQAPEEEISRLRLDLITPLRLKFENRLNADLPFHVLIRAALRRVSSLFSFYNNGEPELDYRGLVKRAEEVCIKENQLKWYDWRRYSFRQEQGMLMGGITGKVVYEGKIAEFIPLLELCEKLHIGKQTAFGLGKFEMEIME
jgi:CRISPR/Cas system endoribonuclease Cas6 (RAMP superfamily)